MSIKPILLHKYQLNPISLIVQKTMEDKPAGKQTPNNPPIDSPKKKSNPIGIESQWSLGWNGENRDIFNRPNNSKGFNSYHNQSSIILGEGKGSQWKKEEHTKGSDMKKKVSTNERPVWNYDPKKAGKTTMVLGDDKPDYRKKDQVYKERTPTTLTISRKK